MDELSLRIRARLNIESNDALMDRILNRLCFYNNVPVIVENVLKLGACLIIYELAHRDSRLIVRVLCAMLWVAYFRGRRQIVYK